MNKFLRLLSLWREPFIFVATNVIIALTNLEVNMKWEDRRRSSNVKRGSRAPMAVGGGIGGIVIMLLLYFLGVDPSVVTNDNQQVNQNTQIESSEVSKERETLEDFLSVILADTEDVWHEKFEENGVPIMKQR